jgi:hypothetical protein
MKGFLVLPWGVWACRAAWFLCGGACFTITGGADGSWSEELISGWPIEDVDGGVILLFLLVPYGLFDGYVISSFPSSSLIGVYSSRFGYAHSFSSSSRMCHRWARMAPPCWHEWLHHVVHSLGRIQEHGSWGKLIVHKARQKVILI